MKINKKQQTGMILRGAQKVSDIPGYSSYHKAKQRCQTITSSDYKWYGGRGIEFRFTSFAQFISHVGVRPGPEFTIDRIDKDGHYEIGNVRWATQAEQVQNSSKSKLTYDNVLDIQMLLLAGFACKKIAEHYGVHMETIYRIKQGRSWTNVS